MQEAVDTVVQILQCGIPMAKLGILIDYENLPYNRYSYVLVTALFALFHILVFSFNI